MSQCHNVTIAQLSKCIVSDNLSHTMLQLPCTLIKTRHICIASSQCFELCPFWDLTTFAINWQRKCTFWSDSLRTSVPRGQLLKRFLKGEYELSTRALSGWMLMICTVWFGVTLDEHGLQSRLTWWHRRHSSNLVTQAAATRRVTSKHVYDRSLSQWYTHCKGNNANLRQQGFMKQFEEIFNEQA